MDYESKKRMIIYGPPATGKTLSLCTVSGSLHVIDYDRQLKSLVVAWQKAKKAAKDLSWKTIDTRKTPGEAFLEAKNAMFHLPKGYDFYALDCYTTFGLISTHFCCGVGQRKYNQQTGTEMMSYITDYFWQVANDVEKMGAWLVVIMHEKWQEIDDGSYNPKSPDAWKLRKTFIAPEVASSARVTIPASCDFVFHIEKKKTFGKGAARKSVFRTEGTDYIMAKAVGYEDILQEVEDADIGAIVRKLGLLPKTQKANRSVTKLIKKGTKRPWQK